MSGRGFIRIGAPAGDGAAAARAEAAPAPARAPERAAETAAPPAEGAGGTAALPAEVFGDWVLGVRAAAERARADAPGDGGSQRLGEALSSPADRRPPAPTRSRVAAQALRAAALPAGAKPPAPGRRGTRTGYEEQALNAMRHSGRLVEAVCFDGQRVVGQLVNFDQYALIVEVAGEPQVLFKHGIILLRYAEAPTA